MKKCIFFGCLSLLLFTCFGQNRLQNKKSKTGKLAVIRTVKQIQKMDTIYTQQHDQLLLTFIRKEEDAKVEWTTQITKTNGKPTRLQIDSVQKNLAWKFQEQRNESPLNLYNISGSFLDENDLYVVYNRFGQVSISRYAFSNDEKFKTEKVLIQDEMASGSFGNFVNHAQFRKINNALFFTLNTGQSFTGTKLYLFKIQSNLKDIKQVSFRQEMTRLKTMCVSESGKLSFEQIGKSIANYDRLNTQEKQANQSIAPTQQERADYDLLQKYIDKPFAFIKISNEEEKHKFEETTLENAGLTAYNLFFDATKKNIDPQKFKQAEKFINEALDIATPKSQVKLVDYIYDDGQENTFYFFCDDGLRIKIIRFRNDEWLIGNFDELNAAINDLSANR